MVAALWSLLQGVRLRLAAYAAAAVVILGLFFSVKRAGRRELEVEQLESALNAVQKRKETERVAGTLSRDELDRRLQPYYRD